MDTNYNPHHNAEYNSVSQRFAGLITQSELDAFLKRYRAWRSFYRNVKINGYSREQVRKSLRDDPMQVISCMFIWRYTPEYERNDQYWYDLDKMWRKQVRKLALKEAA